MRTIKLDICHKIIPLFVVTFIDAPGQLLFSSFWFVNVAYRTAGAASIPSEVSRFLVSPLDCFILCTLIASRHYQIILIKVNKPTSE